VQLYKVSDIFFADQVRWVTVVALSAGLWPISVLSLRCCQHPTFLHPGTWFHVTIFAVMHSGASRKIASDIVLLDQKHKEVIQSH
jgi:hypothetical protein